MKSLTYIIQDEVGIHARPAGLMVKAAKEFKSQCIMQADGKSADMRRLIALIKLGVVQGTRITITANGPDEDEAISTFQKFLEENL